MEEQQPFTPDVRNELADRLADVLKIPDARTIILGLMADYEISRKETSLIPYDGGCIEGLIRRFLVAKKVQGCTDRTIKTYNQSLRFAFGKMGKSPVVITHTDVQALITGQIVAGNSKAYQSLVHRTLSSFYTWMMKEEIITKNPMMKVDSIKLKPPHKQAFSELEIEKIRRACITNRDKAVIELLLSTGCRAFELCGLTREQAQRDEIEIVGKGEKPRTVYMNAKARLAVDDYLAERKDENPFLFPASMALNTSEEDCHQSIGRLFNGHANWYIHPEKVHPAEPMRTDGLRGIVHRIGKKAGVTDCHPHRFRRTCATLALKHGMPVTVVQMLLGHENLETTQRYLDIREEELKAAHRKYVV